MIGDTVLHRAGTRRIVAAGLLVAVMLSAPPAPQSAFADPLNDRKLSLDAQIADLREILNGASEELVEAAVLVKRTQTQLVEAGQTRDNTQLLLRTAQRQDADLASRLAVAQAQEGKAARELATVQTAQLTIRNQVGHLARHTYIGETFSGLAVVLQTESPEEFTGRMAAAEAVFRARSKMIDRLSVQQVDLRNRRARLGAARAQVVDLKHQATAVVVKRQTAQQAATRAEQRVARLLSQRKTAQAVIQADVAAERKRVNALAAEQSKLQRMLMERARAAEAAQRRQDRRKRDAKNRRSGRDARSDGNKEENAGGVIRPSGAMSWPARGPITSPFGRRFHPILKIWRLHSGIDLGLPCGTPVRAASDGRVISAGSAGGYGLRVVVDHGRMNGGNFVTDYNHLSRIVVRKGAVRKGQLIAYSGTTGLSTGCHLHFDTLIDGAYTNPLLWL